MTSHLTWSVKLVLFFVTLQSHPTSEISKASWPTIWTSDKHFSILMTNENFTINSLSLPQFLLWNAFRCFVPFVYNNHSLVIFRHISANGGKGSSESIFFWKIMQCREDNMNFRVRQPWACSRSPPSCFV